MKNKLPILLLSIFFVIVGLNVYLLIRYKKESQKEQTQVSVVKDTVTNLLSSVDRRFNSKTQTVFYSLRGYTGYDPVYALYISVPFYLE
jgi:hypothetical protein